MEQYKENEVEIKTEIDVKEMIVEPSYAKPIESMFPSTLRINPAIFKTYRNEKMGKRSTCIQAATAGPFRDDISLMTVNSEDRQLIDISDVLNVASKSKVMLAQDTELDATDVRRREDTAERNDPKVLGVLRGNLIRNGEEPTNEQNTLVVGMSRGKTGPETFRIIPNNAATIRMYVCSKCDGRFFTKNVFVAHIKTNHPSVELYTCGLCPTVFLTKNEHDGHFKTHRPSERLYSCDKCPRKFRMAHYYRSHLARHQTPATDHLQLCDVCGKLYRKIHEHQRSIHSNLVFSCSVCPKTFCSSTKLRQHRYTHSDARPYPCETCGVRFKQRDKLREHSRIHLDIRPYSCNICGKRFVQPFNLVIHRRTHTGEMPYRCGECGMEYAFSSSYLAHMRTKHGKDIPIVRRKAAGDLKRPGRKYRRVEARERMKYRSRKRKTKEPEGGA